ncbi:MAG: hypothetical protein SO152_08160 [Ruminococcus sp.]|nr:hypothetical protein [Ruminococcus sp.]
MNNKKQEQFISKENKKRILLCVNALLMVVLIVVATYAWFSRNTVDDINVNEIAFQGSSDLEVSLDDTNYAFSQTLSFNSSSLAQDITGSGLPTKFVRPSIKSSTNNSTLSVPDKANLNAWNANLSGKDKEGQTQSSDYKIKTIYFRSKKAMTVYLGDGSQVLGAAEVNNKKLVGTSEEVGNKSTVKGVTGGTGEVSVSKDCIVGATRFAFLNAGKTDVKCLWIPRPNIFYETYPNGGDIAKTIHGGTSSSDLSTSYNIKSSVQAYPNSKTHYYYKSDGTIANAAKVIAGNDNLSTTSGGKTGFELVELTKASENDTYYKGSINVVIWVEGCDAEARQAFAGGKFGATLRFVGIEKQTS